jgi:hypothetical protein
VEQESERQLSVHGVGICATLPLPVSKRALEGMQYRIGDAAHWQKLVDNIAAIVAELDRTCVRQSRPQPAPRPSGSRPRADLCHAGMTRKRASGVENTGLVLSCP